MKAIPFQFGKGNHRLFSKKRHKSMTDDIFPNDDCAIENEMTVDEGSFHLDSNIDLDNVQDLLLDYDDSGFDLIHEELEHLPQEESEEDVVDFNIILFNLFLQGSKLIQGNENNVITILILLILFNESINYFNLGC